MNRANLKIFLGAIVCAFGFCATVVEAHHSFATYDQTKTQTLKGTVKAFQWTNPHTVIWIMVQPEGGGAPQEWTIETTRRKNRACNEAVPLLKWRARNWNGVPRIAIARRL